MKFNIIYADCPWRFKNWSIGELAKRGEKWARANGRSPYDVMLTSDIASIPVSDIAAKDSILFLWATYPKLQDALDVMKGWGFEYKTVGFTWVKTNPKSPGWHFGLGYWTRQNPELCLLGTRGKPKRISASIPNLVIHPRTSHSAKPPQIRDMIVNLCGDLPRVELFARPPVPDDWVALGNEIDGLDIFDSIREYVD